MGWDDASGLDCLLRLLNFSDISSPHFPQKLSSRPRIQYLSGVFEDRCKWVCFDTQSPSDRMAKGQPLSSVRVVDVVD